jgi:L-iditol 2-dehydrogenase
MLDKEKIMIEKGKAAVLYSPRDVGIDEITIKQPALDQALIRIKACGVCPTDVRSYTGLRKGGYPRTLGHEWVGEIVETGKEFHGFNVGDRVAADWRVVCGKCYYCRRGIFNYCQNTQNEKVSGGFCEYGVSIASNLRIIPDSVSYEEATFTEPLACCINGNRNSNVTIGDDVVIIGSGPIGMLHVQLAKHHGARVIVSDPIESRLEVAKEIGADDTINPTKVDVVKRVMEMTEGRGANSVIVAVGTPEAAKLGIDIAGIYGTVNFFAGTYPPGEIALDPNVVHYKQLILTGSHDFTPHDFTTALKLIEYGIVKVKPIISHVIPLDDIASAFETVADRKGLKVVVKSDPLI